ncbi:hypothetical protein BJX64DRAFT_252456 [Aspergillus heterothallicus]
MPTPNIAPHAQLHDEFLLLELSELTMRTTLLHTLFIFLTISPQMFCIFLHIFLLHPC